MRVPEDAVATAFRCRFVAFVAGEMAFLHFLMMLAPHFWVYRVREEFRGYCEELPVSRYKGETIACYGLGRGYL